MRILCQPQMRTPNSTLVIKLIPVKNFQRISGFLIEIVLVYPPRFRVPTPGSLWAHKSRHGRVNDSPSRTDQINLVHADSFSLQTKDKPSPTDVNKENIESEPNPDIKDETKFQDLSDLPFSIPKLERKLREQNASSSSLEISKPSISIRPFSLFVPVPDSNPDHDPSIFINSGINLRNQDVGTNPGSPHFSSEPLSKPSLKPLSLNLSGPNRGNIKPWFSFFIHTFSFPFIFLF